MRVLPGCPTRVWRSPARCDRRTLFARGQSPQVRVSPAASHAKVVDLIPAASAANQSRQRPFLAVQAAILRSWSPRLTPNPISNTGNAPLYVSEDAGNTWVLSAITPVQRMTCDITHAMSIGEKPSAGRPSRGHTRLRTSVTLDESESDDVSSSPS